MFSIAVSDVQKLQQISPGLGRLVKIITKESTSPSLSDLRVPDAEGAIIQARAARLWPYKFVSSILEDLIEDGFLNLQTNTPVTSLQKVKNSDGLFTLHNR